MNQMKQIPSPTENPAINLMLYISKPTQYPTNYLHQKLIQNLSDKQADKKPTKKPTKTTTNPTRNLFKKPMQNQSPTNYLVNDAVLFAFNSTLMPIQNPSPKTSNQNICSTRHYRIFIQQRVRPSFQSFCFLYAGDMIKYNTTYIP